MTKQIVHAFELLQAIGGTTSRTAKEDYLRQGEGNPVFKEILLRTYDPEMIFGIKKKSKTKPLSIEFNDDLQYNYDKYLLLTNLLASRDLTGNAALEALDGLMSTCGSKEAEWYMKSIQKDFKIGITAKSINKVFPGFIETHTCALAKALKKYPKRYTTNPKFDGYRCNAFHHHDGRVELKSRNGKIITGYDAIEQDVAKLPRGYVYDGEIMAPSGKFSDVQKSAFKKTDSKEGILHMFDCLTIEEFEAGESKTIYEERIDHMEYLDHHYIQDLPLWFIEYVRPEGHFEDSEESQQAVFEIHRRNVALGYEGTMLKDLDATYKCKKCYDMQKIVGVKRIDLPIVGTTEGREGTMFEGTLGALVVAYKDNTVNVGEGVSHELRDELWVKRDELINQTIEVEYREETTNSKTGKKSLRFPVFIRFRPDKD